MHQQTSHNNPHLLRSHLRDALLGRLHHHDRDTGDAGWDWAPFGGRGRGRGGPWGRPGPRERIFDRGDLKYVILDLLAERPRHGYDIIRALEDRFNGLYSPSPGTVYPTLQLLEDQGYVTSSQQDGKKVYTVTEAGRAFLAEQAATIEAIRARMEAGRAGDSRVEMHALMNELRSMAQTVFNRTSRRAFDDPEKVRRLRGVVARAREEIDAILADRPSQTPSEL
jgi:DNA-binding PadR family transcriptional regulator